DPRENVDTCRLRGGLERSNARYEIRTIGEVQVMDSLRDARFNDAVTAFSIRLKRPAGIHQQVRRQRSKLLRGIAISIECRRDQQRLRILTCRAEGGRPRG